MELFFWSISLLLLFINPDIEISLCLLKNIGINHCIGCGLGKSIHYFLNLNFYESINNHWLGPFSVVLIVKRILILIIRRVYE